MSRRCIAVLALLLLLNPLQVQAQSGKSGQGGAAYYPDAVWQHRQPADVGMNQQSLKDAIDFAIASETKAPRDLKLNHYQTFGREPFGDAIGPIKDRGDPTGLIIRSGYVVAEWGEPTRVDMTHSVTKSLLSSTVGIAYDRGLIRSIDDTVREYVPPVQIYNPASAGNKADRFAAADLLTPFETGHNR